MGDKTSIEWAANADGSPGATWNPIRARDNATGQVGWHCVHASDGCRFCYAERMNNRLGTHQAFKPTAPVTVYLDEQTLQQPDRWKRGRVIFVCSMTDLGADFVTDEWLDKIWGVMGCSPQHTFIVLTKRMERLKKYLLAHNTPEGGARFLNREVLGEKLGDSLSDHYGFEIPYPLPNVWLGTSAERQREADERIPHLLQTPAAVRFLSAEPLIGPIDLGELPSASGIGRHLDALSNAGVDPGTLVPHRLDWVIAGGESGPGARPMHPAWARDLRDQCAAAGVPFFFKQHGEWWPSNYGSQSPDPDVRSLWTRMSRASSGGMHVTLSGERLQGASEPHVRPSTWSMMRVGKRNAGRLLDGIEHNGRPAIGQQTGENRG